MNSGSIIIIQTELPSTVDGLTHINDDGTYTILINKAKGERKKKETLYHELAHIFGDDFNRFEHASVLEHMLRESMYFKEGDDLGEKFPGINFYFRVV